MDENQFGICGHQVRTNGGDVQRQLTMGGNNVPIGSKTYAVGLRMEVESPFFCSGVLISPKHVLCSSRCSSNLISAVSVGTKYINGSVSIEEIKVVAIMNHPKYLNMEKFALNDFTVLELSDPSDYPPVKMATADDSEYKAGKWAVTMGYGTESEVSYELQRLDVQLLSDKECATYAHTDSSVICAGGKLGQDICHEDLGGPLILEGSSDEEDVLIGIVSGSTSSTCGREGYPIVFSRVSKARAWIDSITSGTGTCYA